MWEYIKDVWVIKKSLYLTQQSEWVSRVLRPARYIIGHFGDESFQAITRTGIDNSKQTGENTPKTQNKQTNSR